MALTATLVSPIDIRLDWTGAPTEAAGRIVEFATEPNGPYTILQFLPPQQTTYLHPDLIPETPFYYRLRSFYGPASNSVEIALPDPPPGENIDAADHAWARPQTLPSGVAPKPSPIRVVPPGAGSAEGNGAATAGAPTDLAGTVMHSQGIRFTWTDHASDEEGFFLEVKAEGARECAVVAVIDPNVNSFGLITLPSEKKAFYRVRAFYYEEPSRLAHQTTGKSD